MAHLITVTLSKFSKYIPASRHCDCQEKKARERKSLIFLKEESDSKQDLGNSMGGRIINKAAFEDYSEDPKHWAKQLRSLFQAPGLVLSGEAPTLTS